MLYLDFLRTLHEVLRPRTYLEIGIRNGGSLVLSHARTIAIDPHYSITEELACDLRLARCGSDAFFKRPDAFASFGGTPIDLAFIDGMHLFEFALRDLMNVERHASGTSVIVFDDVLPRSAEEAARGVPTTGDWTGDVWKIIPVLGSDRRDLALILVDTQPTGLLLVIGCDPTSDRLADRYSSYVSRMVDAEPELPGVITARTGAVAPEAVLNAPFWDMLRAARDTGLGRDPLVRDVRRWMRSVGGDVPKGLWPENGLGARLKRSLGRA